MIEIDLAIEKPELRKLLLIGQEGTGKTRFIGTMPKPAYVFSFDKGYRTLAGIPGIKVGVFMDENRFSPKAYSEFKLQFDAFKAGKIKYKWPDGREEAYKTIAIDSLTALSKYILDHEQRMNNTIDKPGGFGVWGNVKSKLQDIVTQSVLLAEHTVFTAIIEVNKDDLTGEIFYTPSIEGSFRNEVGQWVDAVLFLAVDKNSQTGEKNYQMLTVGDRRYRAKVRIPSSIASVIKPVEEPDYAKLMDKITKAYEAQGGTNVNTLPNSKP